jgi:adenylate cyclase
VGETRKIAAIRVADVVGYSLLAGADEDRTLSRLRALRSDLIDPAIAAHHERTVKRTGDGNLVEFRSMVDAVRCATDVQNGRTQRRHDGRSSHRVQDRHPHPRGLKQIPIEIRVRKTARLLRGRLATQAAHPAG